MANIKKKYQKLKIKKIVYDELITVVPSVYRSPLQFAIKQINFQGCISAPYQKLDLQKTPYLVPVIQQLDYTDQIKEITLVLPQQMGKTLLLIISLLWSMKYKGGSSLVVYQSDDLAEAINRDKILPLMRNIPELNNELNRPLSHRKDGYYFSDTTSIFQGSGKTLTSHSAPLLIADELDEWSDSAGASANLEHLKLRKRAFNESLLLKVCSVKGSKSSSKIWAEFLAGSQGYFYMRCLGCKELTMRACDVHNLEFNRNENDEIIPESIKLICPLCKHEHKEKDKKELANYGNYIHRKPERIEKGLLSYQCGALSSFWHSLSWEKIGQLQILAGKGKCIEDQISFDNMIRGLPFTTRKLPSERQTSFENKAISKNPDDEKIKYVLMSVDSQDNGWWWLIRGYDDQKNSYLLDFGFVISTTELEEKWNQKYCSKLPLLGIIDQGGHRGREIEEFLENRQGFYSYKGGSFQFRFDHSKNKEKLILVKARLYQAELLYTMYNTSLTGQGDWTYPENISKEYKNQLTNHEPKAKAKTRFNDAYENWQAVGQDHLFDCEKMALVLNEFYQLNIKSKPKKSKVMPKFIN